MLNGIDPIIIIELFKVVTDPTETKTTVPVKSQNKTFVPLPPIPIYLSENLTGLFIDSEDKSVDAETQTDTLENGEAPEVNQKAIGSTVSINIVANKNSLGLSLISALIDQIYEKLTSKEYAITYLNGSTTIFRAMLHNYSVQKSANNDLMNIKIELTKGDKRPTPKTGVLAVAKSTGVTPL